MSKYTETPWLYSHNTVSGSNGSETVAEVYGFDTLEKRANGKLIAAAPDLLEALQTLQTAIGYAAENNFVYAISKQDIDLIDAAILKAVQP